MCRKLTLEGMASEEARCEDKATSTDDELLASPQTEEHHPTSEIAAVAQLWGADLVGLEPPRHLKPHRRALQHQESVSSASDVSRTRPSHKGRKPRTVENVVDDGHGKGRTKELRKQWTTDSSDSGYSKGYSRERLRRQDTEESVESSKKFIKELQRQPTTESSSSLRQSSLRSGSDNQSIYLMRRQSTVETYDEFSTTDFSRPQSSNSAAQTASPCIPPAIHIESPHCSREEESPPEVPADNISYIHTQDPIVEERSEDFAALSVIPSTMGAPLLTSISCSLINLSAIELEASQILEIQRGLICVSKIQKANARRKRRRRELAKQAAKVCRSRERTRPSRNKDELPKKVRWSIMATGLVLFLMSIILVGATLRMAPLIDEMVRKENEDILQKWLPVAPVVVDNSTSALTTLAAVADSSIVSSAPSSFAPSSSTELSGPLRLFRRDVSASSLSTSSFTDPRHHFVFNKLLQKYKLGKVKTFERSSGGGVFKTKTFLFPLISTYYKKHHSSRRHRLLPLASVVVRNRKQTHT